VPTLTPYQMVEIDKLGRKIFDYHKPHNSGIYHPGAFDWCPSSLMIVICENGVYLDKYTYGSEHLWNRWEEEICLYLGYDVFFESINPAVSALYES